MSDKQVHNPQIGDSMAKHIHRQTSRHETHRSILCGVCCVSSMHIANTPYRIIKKQMKGENLKFPVTLNEEITTGNI